MAKQLVSEGAYVFITGRREPELTTAVQEIGRDTTGVRGDVSSRGDLDRLFARIKTEKVGLESADHPTDGQIVARAKTYFKASDRMG